MTEKQIPKLAGTLVEHQGFFKPLSDDDAQWAIQHPQEAIALFVFAVTNRLKEGANKAVQKLLAPLATIRTVAVTKFIAADYFRIGETVDDVNISRAMGCNFTRHFIPKIESNVTEVEIKVHELLTGSRDIHILNELECGEGVAETSLAHLWQALKLQGNGKEGALLTDGCANIFYIRDVNKVLWAVYVGWHINGWRLDAYSTGSSLPWSVGSLVCSC